MPFIEPLSLMKVINALAAGIMLVYVKKILTSLNIHFANYFVFFIGTCFGVMRFATENETYLLPLLFSVMGTHLFLVYTQRKLLKYLFLSALCFATSALFHQIHIFWYLGFILALFLENKKDIKQWMVFSVTGGLLISVTYLFFYTYSSYYLGKGFLHFVLNDLYAGQVQTMIGWSNVIMTPISFIRSFVQVHGYMWRMFQMNGFLWIIPVILLFVLFVCIKALFKYSKMEKSSNTAFSKAVFYAFIFHFFFAFYSVGNAEFMVMLPLLMVLWAVGRINMPTKPIFFLAFSLLIWNVVFGLAPLHFLDLDGSKELSQVVKENQGSNWLLNEPQKIENIVYYETGNPINAVTMLRENDLKSILKYPPQHFELYTDLLGSDKLLNRQSFLHDAELSSLFAGAKIEKMDSISFFGGQKQISKIYLNAE